jgi:SpoIID/LytB domain protein
MKNLLKITILSVLTLLSSFCYAKSNKIDVPDDIRVGLFYGSNAKSSFTLSCAGGIEIGTMNDGEFEYEDETLPNEKITVTKSSKTGAIYIDGYGDIGDEDNHPYFKSIENKGEAIIEIDGKKYRGNIEVRRFSESDMTVINHVTMQEYLYGVVPREIGGNSPIEAVKAQAIVARTFAARNYNKRIKLGFNLAPNAEDQAYGGYEWEVANSNKAVDETDGIVVTYDGELISGLYFSTSGGYTESAENVWGGSYDYLKAVPDTYEPEIEGNTSWEVTMSATEVKNSLAKNGVNVGDVVELTPTKYTDAGRVLELKVVGTNGEEIITKSNVRTYLGLKSQWYTINDKAPTVESVVNAHDEDSNEEEPKADVDEDSNDKAEEKSGDSDWYLKYEIPTVISKNPTYPEDENVFVVDKKSGEDVDAPEEVSGETVDIPKAESGEEIENTKEESGEELDSPEESVEELIELTEEELSGEHIIIIQEYNACVAVDINNLLASVNEYAKELEIKSGSGDTGSKYTKYEAKNQTFTFRGRGWGHAVGMSQNGAKGMAKEGFTAEEIIKWYYTGVTLEK